jgi:hypothetical protein
MWLQIVGKFRLAVTPWINHSRQAAFCNAPTGFHDRPNEVPDPVPFDRQTQDGAYDPGAAEDFRRALIAVDRQRNARRVHSSV